MYITGRQNWKTAERMIKCPGSLNTKCIKQRIFCQLYLNNRRNFYGGYPSFIRLWSVKARKKSFTECFFVIFNYSIFMFTCSKESYFVKSSFCQNNFVKIVCFLFSKEAAGGEVPFARVLVASNVALELSLVAQILAAGQAVSVLCLSTASARHGAGRLDPFGVLCVGDAAGGLLLAEHHCVGQVVADATVQLVHQQCLCQIRSWCLDSQWVY